MIEAYLNQSKPVFESDSIDLCYGMLQSVVSMVVSLTLGFVLSWNLTLILVAMCLVVWLSMTGLKEASDSQLYVLVSESVKGHRDV